MKNKIMFVLRACIAAPIHYTMIAKSYVKAGVGFTAFSLFMALFVAPAYFIGYVFSTIGIGIVALVMKFDQKVSTKFEKQFSEKNKEYNKYVKSDFFKKLKRFLHNKELK
jgi:predicted membrane protein